MLLSLRHHRPMRVEKRGITIRVMFSLARHVDNTNLGRYTDMLRITDASRIE